jgi:lipoyl(octanoyl) transferase
LQQRLARELAAGERPDTLLLLEHQPVYTTGRRDVSTNLRLAPELLGAPLVETDRGGDITFHGPGQLIGYPTIDLRAAKMGVVNYVRGLEEVITRTLRSYGIESGTECGLTGVWVPPPSASSTTDCRSPLDGGEGGTAGRGVRGKGSEKIAAIGVRVSRPGGAGGGWIATHGLALNVSVDLAWFERIVPCGIADRGVTSIQRLLVEAPEIEAIADRLAASFGEVFSRRMRIAEGLRSAAVVSR